MIPNIAEFTRAELAKRGYRSKIRMSANQDALLVTMLRADRYVGDFTISGMEMMSNPTDDMMGDLINNRISNVLHAVETGAV